MRGKKKLAKKWSDLDPEEVFVCPEEREKSQTPKSSSQKLDHHMGTKKTS